MGLLHHLPRLFVFYLLFMPRSRCETRGRFFPKLPQNSFQFLSCLWIEVLRNCNFHYRILITVNGRIAQTYNSFSFQPDLGS